MYDVELILCTRPVDPRITPLLDQLIDEDRPRALREPLLIELRAIVADERAGSVERWTPYYDRVLDAIARASDEGLLERGTVYHYEPEPFEQSFRVVSPSDFDVHVRLVEQLEQARLRGAWTLAAAFDQLTIGNDELHIWFGLCPDPASLDRRLRAASLAYLRATADQSPDRAIEEELIAAVEGHGARDEIHELRMRWFSSQPSLQRWCALGLAITEGATTSYDFTNMPPQLLELLGNPFDPRV